ncbi:GAF domain-containing sensor histidine kinase [Oceanicola sp. 502str15]|uniref:GAF domain-containing sensor histidine kinase n=1 Tax=Oceanicola sp. 502str15 TaxID=2696061 RepID=UPI0020958A7E|nr:GAF domain-containing sensor histidine kinase [Oceanicola sp. 502str15]MCO6383408.1 GAF domain-containing protein [Oceanicola sp. 502str15]
MNNGVQRAAVLQDHAAFQAGNHDFQADIEMLAASELVGTILETVMLATNMRFAAVARVTADRWVACRTVDEVNFGIAAGDEIEIQSTFCQSVRESFGKVLFNDVATDEVYQNHPIAMKFGIVSYASIPILRSDGTFFGTLCAIDTVPRNIKHPRAVAMLEMFADLIGRSLETEERLKAQEELVERERKLSRLQEEFVAVLGHDLRNPVAAFEAGLRQISHEPLSERGNTLLSLMRSTVRRMNDLIENIMLHAKSRLGGGIRVSAVHDAPLAEAITEVVEEIRAATPEQEIRLDLSFGQPVSCDPLRVAQAVSNLLSNAARHCRPDTPVEVHGTVEDNVIEITVSNQGEDVPEDVRERLFQPFERGTEERGEGLGLGLYIAASIATAHGGRISVDCTGGVTSFTLSLPALPVED